MRAEVLTHLERSHVLGPMAKATAEKNARVTLALRDLHLQGFSVLVDPTAAILDEVARSGAGTAITTLKAKVPDVGDIAIPSDGIAHWARAHAAELVGMRRLDDGTVITNPDARYAIGDATRELLRGTIAQAFDEEWTKPELEDALASSYAFSEDRAALIARTEVSRALVEGNRQAWRSSGVVMGRRAILGSEHDIDDVCNDNVDAGVIAMDEAYPSGDMAPPFHPNCVCDELPVLAGEE